LSSVNLIIVSCCGSCERLVCVEYSDEDTSVEALVMRWLQTQDEDDRDVLSGWIKDYFYDALKWILEQVIHDSFCC